MAAISINDNFMMCVCFHVFLVDVLKTHQWHPVECKLNAFISLFALQNCTYLIVAMTIDKYIALKWPHRAATYSTTGRAKSDCSGFVCLYTYLQYSSSLLCQVLLVIDVLPMPSVVS